MTQHDTHGKGDQNLAPGEEAVTPAVAATAPVAGVTPIAETGTEATPVALHVAAPAAS